MGDKLYFYKILSVDRIIDGDTFVCTIDLGFCLSKKIVVRILDCDSFESRHTHKCKKQAKKYNLTEKCIVELGKKLKHVLEDVLFSSSDLYIKTHKLDAFGRALGTIYKDEINIVDILEKAKQSYLLETKCNQEDLNKKES